MSEQHLMISPIAMKMLLNDIRAKGAGSAKIAEVIVNSARQSGEIGEGRQKAIGERYGDAHIIWLLVNHEGTQYIKPDIYPEDKTWFYEENSLYIRDIPQAVYTSHVLECKFKRLRVNQVVNEAAFGSGLIANMTKMKLGNYVGYHIKDHWSKGSFDHIPENAIEWQKMAMQ